MRPDQASVPANMQNDVREMHLRKGDHCAISILAWLTAAIPTSSLRPCQRLLEEDEQGVDF